MISFLDFGNLEIEVASKYIHTYIHLISISFVRVLVLKSVLDVENMYDYMVEYMYALVHSYIRKHTLEHQSCSAASALSLSVCVCVCMRVESINICIYRFV